MKLSYPPEASSFSSYLDKYREADLWIFLNTSGQEEECIKEICWEAHRQAHQLRSRFGDRSPWALAEAYGVEISQERWRTAEGRIAYLAECTISPPRIRLNLEAIESLVRYCMQNALESERRWFTLPQIIETVIAHELFHIIHHRSSSPLAELSAHAFARELLGLPFSPILYQELLKESLKMGPN